MGPEFGPHVSWALAGALDLSPRGLPESSWAPAGAIIPSKKSNDTYMIIIAEKINALELTIQAFCGSERRWERRKRRGGREGGGVN